MEYYENWNPVPEEEIVDGEYTQNGYQPNYFTPPAPEPMPPYLPKPKQKKKCKWVGTLAIALSCSLVGGLLGACAVVGIQNLQAKKADEPAQIPEAAISYMLQGQRTQTTLEIVEVDTGTPMTPAQVYAANVNSTVGITTSVTTTNFWGYQSTGAASGSGFIISDDGYILTNHHVIDDSDSISVSMYNGDSYDATLIGYDESNDIAVLKIDAEGLSPVILGNSDNLNVGDNVVAIGNPLGELTFSLTSGAISAKDREVTFSSDVTMNLLQTDCAINSGNSGGALFNLYGEVVGVTNAKYSTSSSSSASIDNIGFAIPINSIMNIVESIIENGYISKPYIGIHLVDVPEQTQMYGIPAGIAVQKIVENGPAAQAGLQVGDIVVAVNGEAMLTSEFISFIGKASVGDKLVLSVYRQGENLEITVTIGEQIQAAIEETQPQVQQQIPQQGFPGNFPFSNNGKY